MMLPHGMQAPRHSLQALMRHSIGRSWRRSRAGAYPVELLQLLRYFYDAPDAGAMFSLHNLCVAGAAHG